MLPSDECVSTPWLVATSSPRGATVPPGSSDEPSLEDDTLEDEEDTLEEVTLEEDGEDDTLEEDEEDWSDGGGALAVVAGDVVSISSGLSASWSACRISLLLHLHLLHHLLRPLVNLADRD